MPAWYNELPFAYVTPKLREWWKTYSPEESLSQFELMAGVPWNNWHVTYQNQQAKLEPGKLWWPTGASRFGVYTGVAGGDVVNQWRKDTEGESESAVSRTGLEFFMKGIGDNELSKTMYMLPPRPLPYSGIDNKLWIVTLVDERYWWWYYNCDDLAAEPVGTWDDLFDMFREKLEIAEEDWDYTTPDEAYLTPGDLLAQASHVPLPVLMDAAAWSIGCRVVVDFDLPEVTGKVSIMSLADSRLNREKGLKLKQVLSGGRYDMRSTFGATDFRDAGLILPSTVRVSYPRVDDTGEVIGRTAYDVDVATVDGFDGYSLFGEAVIYDTAETSSDEPDDSDLIFLADQLAKDYLGYEAEANINITLAGVVYLDPCGLYDAVEYHEYIEDDSELRIDGNDIDTPVLNVEKERVMAYTKVSRQPFLWRVFTLHHGGEGGGGSGSTGSNWIYCNDGSTHTFTITRQANGKYIVQVY